MNDTPINDSSNGKKRRTINVKFDGSMVTAILALFAAGGFGLYGAATGVGKVDIVDTQEGVTIQVNEVQKRSYEVSRRLVRLVKVQRQEIDELYETVDWLKIVLVEIGKHHPSTLRKLRREAPPNVNFGFTAEGKGGNAGVFVADAPPEEDPDDLLKEIEDEPKRIEFPDLTMIREARERRGEQ